MGDYDRNVTFLHRRDLFFLHRRLYPSSIGGLDPPIHRGCGFGTCSADGRVKPAHGEGVREQADLELAQWMGGFKPAHGEEGA